MYDTILFDLDGTLTDPGVGITNSVAHALKKFGMEVKDRSQLYKFIGPPLMESFTKYYDFTPEQCTQAVVYYREYFAKDGIFENEIYEGAERMLKDLKAAGKRVVLATSKPEPFAVQILEHFKIDSNFDFVAGSLMNETRTKKAEVIAYALEQCQITELSSVVMVGDREHDILGAKQTGIDSIGVLYGYGDREELENAGADYIAESVEDICRLVGV